MFNRYLSRIRTNHPVFGDKQILIIILDYLAGEDLFQMFQVCYSFRATIQSVPIFEISLIKFTISKSNQCIEKLKGSSVKKENYTFLHKKQFFGRFPLKKPWTSSVKTEEEVKKTDKSVEIPDFSQPKWVNFTNAFHEYAQTHGLKILKKDDFDNEIQWKDYKIKYITYYHNYIDSIRQERIKEQKFREIKRKLFNNYRSFVENINFNFHQFTRYRFITPKPNPYLPSKEPNRGLSN